MDKIDQILSKNPDFAIPDGLTDRIKLNFRRKVHFRQRMLVFSAILLIIVGFCVVLPEMAAANEQLNIQPADVSSMPLVDLPLSLQSSATGLLQNITDLQDTLLATFNLPAWLGLFSVAIGSAIGIRGIFPHLRTR